MSNEAPEDEMILAELIAVASAHGLRSCRKSMFRDKKGRPLEMEEDNQPPRNAAACCVQGATQLLSGIFYLSNAALGNDAQEHDIAPNLFNEGLRGWNIGAAFEIALRGSNK